MQEVIITDDKLTHFNIGNANGNTESRCRERYYEFYHNVLRRGCRLKFFSRKRYILTYGIKNC